MILSMLDNVKAGFFSSLFFSVNHYIHCKKHNISFKLDSNNWLYKSKNGWTDYFSHEIELKGNNEEDKFFIFKHDDLLGEPTMYEYRDVLLNDIYIYNEEVKKRLEEKKRELGLINPGTYDSIYIRRGDKLCYESKYYSTEKYIDLLLQKNPNCQTIFIQSDDYNCFLDLKKYIEDKNFDIKLLTLCHPDEVGVVNYEIDVEEKFDLQCDIIHGDVEHKKYFDKIKDKLQKTKPINKMNPDEIYEHTVNMIIGLDIVRHSRYCILDNQSNVSRFINITHDQLQNVFDIRFPNEHFNMNRTKVPAWP